MGGGRNVSTKNTVSRTSKTRKYVIIVHKLITIQSYVDSNMSRNSATLDKYKILPPPGIPMQDART